MADDPILRERQTVYFMLGGDRCACVQGSKSASWMVGVHVSRGGGGGAYGP